VVAGAGVDDGRPVVRNMAGLDPWSHRMDKVLDANRLTIGAVAIAKLSASLDPWLRPHTPSAQDGAFDGG